MVHGKHDIVNVHAKLEMVKGYSEMVHGKPEMVNG